MEIGRSYDYIVVGGGTAGCVIASRLSEDPDARVLLLETGDSGPETTGRDQTQAAPRARGDQADVTVGQRALYRRTFAWPHGLGIGGTSAIDGAVFARGHRSSYDAWPQAGAKGWGFDDLLPFFRRAERVDSRDPAIRGTDGPMDVAPAARPHPVAVAGLEAAEQSGYSRASDISGGLEEGFGLPDLAVKDGHRLSAADAYLRPIVRRRPYLDIVRSATVHRLIVQGQRCIGVEFSAGRDITQVMCEREAVVTAGAIGSPHLLMLSGIGPAPMLRDAGVTVTLPLPGVGANLHDHPVSGIVYSAPRLPLPPLAAHVEALGLVRSGSATAVPDLQLFLVPDPQHAPTVTGPHAGFTVAVALVAPQSRGSLTLAGSSPDMRPLLDPGYLTSHADLAALATGLELAREIGSALALSPWREKEVLPGPATTQNEGLRYYVRESLMPYCNYAGTCRIGEDDMAVVDARLRVRGIGNLRVADASVIPSLPSAGTQPTVLAIAERAAELIRQ
jgi:choline dehydrogenase